MGRDWNVRGWGYLWCYAESQYLFIQEWSPGSGSLPDLFEDLGKSFIMSVFWDYSLASKVCSLNKWTFIYKSCLNFSDERHISEDSCEGKGHIITMIMSVLNLCSTIALKSFQCPLSVMYSLKNPNYKHFTRNYYNYLSAELSKQM